jgi:hypothetical protein
MTLKDILDINQLAKLVWYLGLFSISVSTLFVSAYYFYDDKIVLFTKESFYYDQRSGFNNASDSMGVGMRHGDTALLQDLFSNEPLRLGQVYVYEDTEGVLVSHRIAYCFKIKDNKPIEDLYCDEHIVFRGDNNRVGELVHRNQIKYWVRGLVYD